MMGFDAFIDFLLTFFPLKQMERMKNAVSTHTADSKKDLDNIQDAFRELLPWLGANFHYNARGTGQWHQLKLRV